MCLVCVPVRTALAGGMGLDIVCARALASPRRVGEVKGEGSSRPCPFRELMETHNVRGDRTFPDGLPVQYGVVSSLCDPSATVNCKT